MAKSAGLPATKPFASPSHRHLILLIVCLAVVTAGLFLLWQWWIIEAQADRLTALALAEKNHFAQAEPLLLRALERNPRDLEVVKALALGQRGSGSINEADPYLTRWSELEPDSAQPFKIRMEMNARLFRREPALSDGLRVLALEPNNDSVRRNVVWMLLAVGRLDEAKREANLGLTRLPHDPEFRYLMAKISHVQGQATQAAAQLDSLLSQKPGYLPGLLLRGILYREANQPENALGPLRRVEAESTDPMDRQSARYHLAMALARCGQTKEADAVMQLFRRNLEADRLFSDSEQQPDNQNLQVRASEALIACGQGTKAVRLLTRVLERAPDCIAAHRLLIGFYESKGQPALAEQHRRAISSR